MIELRPGEKRGLADLTSARTVEVLVEHDPADIDVVGFGLDEAKRIGDDRYVVLFSNLASPEGALAWRRDGGRTVITVALDLLPAKIARVTVTATHDTRPLGRVGRLVATVAGAARIDARPALGQERAVMLLDLYRHGGDWRVGAVVQGFEGGLAALVRSLGGEVADDAPAPPPAAPPSPAPAKAAPPVSLSKVDLRKQKVGVTLEKHGIAHERAEVLFVIDASGSMSQLYANGTVQETVERIVPVALRLDDDGTMETWFYANGARRATPLRADNLDGFVAAEMPRPGAAGRSGGSIGFGNEEPFVMRQIIEGARGDAAKPRLVIFLTDGGIYADRKIEELLKKASALPVFWQFVGVGNAEYGVLRRLDTLSGRRIDNAGFFAVDDLARISDDQLYDRLLSEFPAWLREARKLGIVR